MKTQRDEVLQLLKDAGNGGINSYSLTYAFGIKQAPTRVKELRDEGYIITSTTLDDRSVQYVLHKDVTPENRTFRYKFEGNKATKIYI